MNSFKYATKIWLTSVFVSPILIYFYFFIMEGNPNLGSDLVESYGLFVFFGGLFSIPNWLLFALGIWGVGKINLETHEQKTIIQVIAMMLSLLLYLVFASILSAPGVDRELLGIAGSYIASLTLGIWFYELHPSSKPTILNENILDEEI